MKRRWGRVGNARIAMWTGAWVTVLLTVVAVGVRGAITPPPGGGGGCTQSSPCTSTYTYPWSSASTDQHPSTTGCPSGQNIVNAGPSANFDTGQVIVFTQSSANVCEGASITTDEYFYAPDWTAPPATVEATFTFWWYVTWTAFANCLGYDYEANSASASASYYANALVVHPVGYLESPAPSRSVGTAAAPACPWAVQPSGTGPNDVSFTALVTAGTTYQPYTWFHTETQAACAGLCSSGAGFNVGTDTNSATFYELIISYWD